MSEFRIGISGWRYAPWRKNFYPEGLTQARELYFASRSVNSIEINGSFYALQTPERYQNWHDDTPDNFRFSLKAPRYVTHIRRLKDVEHPIANFFASGVLHLKKKLGPILWQFPPSFKFDPELFEAFLELLPHTAKDATAAVQKYREDFENPTAQSQRLRHCVEIRNKSFMEPEFFDLLSKYKVAFVFADSAGRFPYAEEVTSDFIYMRLHGDTELYKSGYTDEALDRWFSRMKTWSRGNLPGDAQLVRAKKAQTSSEQRDIFCYFDNTDKLFAPYDARKILTKLDLLNKLPAEPGKLMVE